MAAIFRWWWGMILSLILQGKRLVKEVLIANPQLLAAPLARSRSTVSIVIGAQGSRPCKLKQPHPPRFYEASFTLLDG